MKERQIQIVDLVIIGGGSAGMAAAISAYHQGLRDILILERDIELGGILQQCIHNGFGLHTFGEELSGPSYAQRYSDQIRELGIAYKTETMVLHLHEDQTIEYVNPREGYVTIQARSIILAMGCRERNRGAISIPGTRPEGVWTAGTAQRYLNMEGYLVGKKIFILGSGDIGLIMARRMTLEGAQVLGVAELMPYSNGLPRNMKQCLYDFDIPLYLSHTVTAIRGGNRVSGIQISQVDEHLQPIPGTEKEFAVDTLLLSVGLIPENYLSEEGGISLHPRTRGPVVDESFQTTIPGVFACGNVLHVHDLVDFVSAEGEKAGAAAARYLQGVLPELHGGQSEQQSGLPTQHGGQPELPPVITLAPGDRSIGYILPQTVHPAKVEKEVEVCFRVTQNYRNAVLRIYKDGTLFREIKKRALVPAEMEKVKLKKEDLTGDCCNMTFQIEKPHDEQTDMEGK